MRHPKRSALLLAAILAAVSACAPKKPAQNADIDLAGMDRSVAPGDDFNAYTNGGWMKPTPIPADKSGYGIDAILTDETRKRTVSRIQDAAKAGASASADARKTGDFYATFMDEAAIELNGIAPLKTQLDAFAAIAGRHALARAIGAQLRADVDALNSTNVETGNLFGIWVTQGLEDPSHTYPYLLQGGLGMPDREYYISPSPQMAQLRKQYLAHVEAMFRLAGFTDPAARAARVFALETAMARVHATRVESEDVRFAVPWKRADLPLKAPGLDWAGAARSRRVERPRSRYRVAPESGHGPLGAGRHAAARCVEGLARAARHRERRGLPPEGVRRREFQLFRQGAQRNSANASAVAARNRFDQLRAG
jgi:predicted metalloendopeptidase